MYDPIKILQVVGNISTGATSLSATLAPPQPGSVLAALVYTDALNSAISLSTLTGQAWTKVLGVDGASTQHDLAAWISTNPGTGTTVTLNNGSSVACGIVVYELTHMPKLANDDGHSNALVSTNSVTTWTCGSVTPTVGCGIALSWYADANSGTVTVPTGYSTDTNSTQTSGVQRIIATRKIKTDLAAESAVWTNGTATTAGFAAEVLLAPSLFPDPTATAFMVI